MNTFFRQVLAPNGFLSLIFATSAITTAAASDAPPATVNVSGSITTTITSPTPAAPSTPMLHFNKPALYVMALGTDALTASRLTVEAAARFLSHKEHIIDSNVTIVSAPSTWTIAD